MTQCSISALMYQQSASEKQLQWALFSSVQAQKERECLFRLRIMIHQPLGGAEGQATDIEIEAKEILRMRRELNSLISKHSGQPIEKINQDTERDNYMSAQQAKDYGLIDAIVMPSQKN